MKVRDAAAFFRDLQLTDWERQVGRMMLEQVQAPAGDIWKRSGWAT